MASTEYHEPFELLSAETVDMHRALVSAIEELEAIDWYQQRADACSDDDLRETLLHNKNEEIEHFVMSLEWIRRRNARFSEQLRRYLFTAGPITEIEEDAEPESSEAAGASLAIGSLKDA